MGETPIEAAWASGRRAWPAIDLPKSAFVSFAKEAELTHAADLYLAAACAEGLPAAIAAFEARYGALIDGAARKAEAVADLAQSIRGALLAGERAKIRGYGGKAPLEHWLRVVVVRAVRSARRKKAEPAGDDALLAELAVHGDPERALGHRELEEAYRRAFAEAFAELAPRERTLLRLHVIDKLGIDALAKMLGGHRATIARQVAAARESLAEATLENVRRATGMSPPELASAMRSIRSQLDLSLRRVLAG